MKREKLIQLCTGISTTLKGELKKKKVRGMYVHLPVYCLKCEAVCTEVNKVFVMVPSVLLDQFQDDHSFKKKKMPR